MLGQQSVDGLRNSVLELVLEIALHISEQHLHVLPEPLILDCQLVYHLFVLDSFLPQNEQVILSGLEPLHYLVPEFAEQLTAVCVALGQQP